MVVDPLMAPCLRALEDGQTRTIHEIRGRVAAEIGITDEDKQEMIKSGISIFDSDRCPRIPSPRYWHAPLRRCLRAHESKHSSAEGSGFFFAGMPFSVVVITAPSPPTQSARRAGNAVRCTVPTSQSN